MKLVKHQKGSENNIKDVDDEVHISRYNSSMAEEIIDARVDELLTLALEEINNRKNLHAFDSFYITGGGILNYKDNIDAFSREMARPLIPIQHDFIGTVDFEYSVPVGILKVVVEGLEIHKKENEDFDVPEEGNKENKKGIISKLKHFIEDFL